MSRAVFQDDEATELTVNILQLAQMGKIVDINEVRELNKMREIVGFKKFSEELIKEVLHYLQARRFIDEDGLITEKGLEYLEYVKR